MAPRFLLVALAAVIGTAYAHFDDAKQIEYPALFEMKDIVENWNPDIVDPPETFAKHDSLARLDYQDPKEHQLGLDLRRAELPFIFYNIPNINEVTEKWTDEYFENKYKGTKLMVDVAPNNHFLFYRRGHGEQSLANPQSHARVSWGEFVEKAKQPPTGDDFWYLQHGSSVAGSQFIMDDIKIFDPKRESEFIIDNGPGDYRGIHCRFGAAGIIAESHYDGHRNFIAMLKGHKRYILNAPDQCPFLGLWMDGPSARHTYVDWSEPANPSREYHKPAPSEWYTALGIDTVLNTGDVLYVPSYWFHNPISLDRSMQCNARSGTSTWGYKQIKDCGFSASGGREDINDVTAARNAVKDRVQSGDIDISSLAMPAGGKLARDLGGKIPREVEWPTGLDVHHRRLTGTDAEIQPKHLRSEPEKEKEALEALERMEQRTTPGGFTGMKVWTSPVFIVAALLTVCLLLGVGCRTTTAVEITRNGVTKRTTF